MVSKAQNINTSTWDGVSFFCSSSYGAVVCICDWSSADSMLVFWLLLSTAGTTSRLFSFFSLSAFQ